MPEPLARLAAALASRAPLVDAAHETAFRLFNGHLEGDPRWVIDAYGRTAVVYGHGATDDTDLGAILEVLHARLPWLQTIVVKEREGLYEARRGRVAFQAPGSDGPDARVTEHGVRYAVDPLLNQDAGFYLDTRGLRRWLLDHAEGKTVLNTFAYTGSLGVAALAGGAARVLHTDLNPRFLEVAQASTALNGLPVDRRDFVARDFFSFVRGAKLRDERFDIAILDPPFFSSTARGELDLNRDTTRLVNKVRPLVRSGGTLVVVNNALFLSGAAFLAELEALCAGGWMMIEALIGVPPDVAGYPGTRVGKPPVEPAPFDHSTKIAVLGVRHR